METNWFKKNYKTIIRISYIIPILVAAGISIYHVITWYNITNPLSWAIYLSIGVEIAALSALAGMTAKMSKFVYVPFFFVTLIQVIGNIFASYQYIDITGAGFKAWVELFDPIFSSFGWVTDGNLLEHKRILGILGGIFIPLISLSFLHLLISFNDKTEKKDKEPEPEVISFNDKTEKKDKEPDPAPKSEPEVKPEPEVDIANIIKRYKSGEKEAFNEIPANVEVYVPDAPVKRTFKIPIGEVSEKEKDDYLKDIINKFKNDSVKFNNTEDFKLSSVNLSKPEEKLEIKEDIQLKIEFPEDSPIVNTGVTTEVLPEKPLINPITEEPSDLVVFKKEFEPIKREPVIPTGTVKREEIPEVKNGGDRGFSVKIPKSNNFIERIGSNKILKNKDKTKVFYKRDKDK